MNCMVLMISSYLMGVIGSRVFLFFYAVYPKGDLLF